MARAEDHLLSPFTEAAGTSVVRGAAYFLAWILGINLPRLVERLILGDIFGRPATYADDTSLGELAATHLFHPLGFLILCSHIVVFAVFVRFEPRYRWVLWPFASGLFWRIFMESL